MFVNVATNTAGEL